jgi:hypothetical protein
MTRDDIIRMAGHREVPPWVMKLVQDCVDVEREECAKCAETYAHMSDNFNALAAEIRARGKK